MSHPLQLILLLLAAAVVALIVCRLVRLPPILGYLGVGILVGPHALAWVPNTTDVRGLAQFGIVFLMFSIGLEFSLSQLKAMRRALFGLGLAQVAITTLLAMIGLHLLGDSWLAGFTLGGALAMSSTAIVSKMLAERMELNSAHGRDIMGILLFQDLAVVAFLIAIPTLAAGAADQLRALPLAVGKAAIALAIILVFGQGPMRAWFHVIARQRSSELFMLNVLLVTLGLAALTRIAGLSFALGAFLAGMLIAETEYRYQVEEDIKPFRDVLLGLFFVTVGMYLDLKEVGANLGWVLLLVIVPVLAKLVLVVILARVFRAPLGEALRTGFYLAQAGEFAIVMVALAVDLAIVDPNFAELIVAAMVLSMLAAPLLIQFAEPMARRFSANDWLARAAQVTQIAARTMARQEHVIICGFGRSGQNLARLLEKEEISFIALEADPQRVREAAADGSSVVYGDAGRREALIAAGLPKAKAIAVTFADTATRSRSCTTCSNCGTSCR
jgi:CPA2 family monovalent cation:H+ antiporter-2